MSDVTELKPCPFCGGEAKKYLFNNGRITITCANWYQHGGSCKVDSSTAYCKRVETCAKHWNTRPIEQALTAELNALREANKNLHANLTELRDLVVDAELLEEDDEQIQFADKCLAAHNQQGDE